MAPLPQIAKEIKLSRTTILGLIQQGKLKGSTQALPSGRSVLVIDKTCVQTFEQERQSLIGFDEARKMLIRPELVEGCILRQAQDERKLRLRRAVSIKAQNDKL